MANFRDTTPQSLRLATFALLIILIGIVYWPALPGTFLFDDGVNLNALGAYGGVTDWNRLLLYLTSGMADPTGRPVSMLSFLIDATDWPAQPGPFKLTNLLIHVLNSALLVRVLCNLGYRAALETRHAERAAVLAGALWALHPLWVSTVAYIVQRQAMLPVTFLLIALLLWDCAWRSLEEGKVRRAWVTGFVGLGLASLCAVLSKANGALTPLLVGLVWWLVYRPSSVGHSGATRPPNADKSLRSSPDGATRLALAALVLPSVVLLISLLVMIPGAIDNAQQYRAWSLGERVLSQPRALLDYLGLLWIPRVGSQGLFADDFVVSTSLFSPWTTAPALLALIALVAAAVRAATGRARVLALSLLFFFAGHLMESGWLPLEPYFEHRNYLPAILLFWPLAIWLTSAKADNLRRIRTALSYLLPVVLAFLTLARASIWGDPALLSAQFVQRSPDSPRAQLWQSSREIDAGRFDLAVPRLLKALAQSPAETALAWNLLSAECAAGVAHPEYLALAEHALATTPKWQGLDRDWISERIADVGGNACPHYQPNALLRLLDAAEGNTRIEAIPDWKQDVVGLRGELALALDDVDSANAYFRQSLSIQPRPDMALRIAAHMGNAGHAREALKQLEAFRNQYGAVMPPATGVRRLHNRLLLRQGYFAHEMDELAAALRASLSESGNPSP